MALAHYVVMPVQVAITKFPGHLRKLLLDALHHLWRSEHAPEHETCLLLSHGDSYMGSDRPLKYTTICPFATILFLQDAHTKCERQSVTITEYYRLKGSNSPDHRRVFDAADDPHGALALWADQRVDFVDFLY
jgi:hypothetical protein